MTILTLLTGMVVLGTQVVYGNILESVTVYESKYNLDKTLFAVTKSGSVIAAGRNTLVQVKQPDNIVTFVNTKCIGNRCDDTSRENGVSLLNSFSLKGREYILFCGTIRNLKCMIVHADNITEQYELISSHHIFKNRVDDTSVSFVEIGEGNFITAQNVSGEGSYTFSRSVISEGSGYWRISRPSHAYQIDVYEGETFEFIYGFSDSEYSYILRNNHTGALSGAYLSQLCKGADELHSYAELDIKCGQYYVTAKSAFYYKVVDAEILATIFCDEYRMSRKTQEHCALCMFNLTKIRQSFVHAKEQCFLQTRGSWPPWIRPYNSISESCTTTKTEGDFLCGYEIKRTVNMRIRGLEALSTDPLQFMDISATGVTMEAGKNKYRVFVTGSNLLKVFLVSEDLTNAILLKEYRNDEQINSMVLDTALNRLYFASQKKIAYLRTDDCSNHGECRYCLSDVIDCQWVVNTETGQEACYSEDDTDAMDNKVLTFSTYCPVQIHEISTLTGPMEGGTVLKLRTNLDNNTEGSHVIIGQNCSCNVSTFSSSPQCTSCSSDREHANVTLVVEYKERADNSLLVPFYGNFTFEKPFVYKIPKIKSEDYPQYVRLRGGVKIILQGSALDIGSNCHVHVGVDTVTYERNDTFIQFIAPPQNKSGVVLVQVQIDAAVLTGPNITYMDNPVISSVWPTKTIKSGGISIEINGTNFKGLGKNVYLGLLNGTGMKDIVYIHCFHKVQDDEEENEETIVCTTQPLGKSHYLISLLPLANVTEEDMTDFKDHHKTLTVLPDPKIDGHSQILYITDDIQEFNFTGSNITNVLQNEVRIVFDKNECAIILFEDDVITCLLNTSAIERHTNAISIKVTIGLNIENDLGRAVFEKNVDFQIGKSAEPPESSNNYSTVTVILVVAIVAIMIFIIAIAVRNVTRKRRRRQDTYSVSYRSGGNIVLDALSSSHNTDADQNMRNIYQEQTFTKSTNDVGACRDTTPLLLDETTQLLLEQQNLLIERDSLVMAEVIGQGHFGCVYKCFYRLPNGKEEKLVAAKTLHRDQPKDMDVKMFLKEALIMKDFHHKHVMELVGICLGMDQLPLVILPYMRCGDLLSYLRDEKNFPKVSDLVMFGIDIANGMHYLAELKFVHRDLAARNCMLSDDLTVKIADFGLSRDVYEKEYYSSCDRAAKLPIKWMSPESLEFRVFSSKSDVWSYGVVLWELLTRGMTPYPTVDNWEVIRYLKEGNRMCKPDHCPSKVYKIMLRCWDWDPDARPTFGSLTIEMPEIIGN